MALPLPPGLTPPEVAFLCELEMISILPRQRLDSVELLGGPTPTLKPPTQADVPLWLALLLTRQHRADIIAPPWLNPTTLERVLKHETEVSPSTFSPPAVWPAVEREYPPYTSPPFIPHSTTTPLTPQHLSLPYHWLELATLLLPHLTPTTTPSTPQIRNLIRDIREVRVSKMRASTKDLAGGGVFSLKGIGAMELCEGRGFIVGVMEGMRRIGGSREGARREREEEVGGGGGGGGDGDSDDDMED